MSREKLKGGRWDESSLCRVNCGHIGYGPHG